MDWKKLLEEMSKSFAMGNSVTAYRRQANSRKQREGESIAEYAQALTQLVEKAYPDSENYTDAMRVGMAIDLFRARIRS